MGSPRRQHRLQVSPRVGLGVRRHRFGWTSDHETPALVAALRSEVNHPVGRLDHVEIVLDDHERVPSLEQFPKGRQQLADVVEVETRRRFVEDVQRPAAAVGCQMRRDL